MAKQPAALARYWAKVRGKSRVTQTPKTKKRRSSGGVRNFMARKSRRSSKKSGQNFKGMALKGLLGFGAGVALGAIAPQAAQNPLARGVAGFLAGGLPGAVGGAVGGQVIGSVSSMASGMTGGMSNGSSGAGIP